MQLSATDSDERGQPVCRDVDDPVGLVGDPYLRLFQEFCAVACFLVFGLGCYFSRRRVQLVAMITTMLLLTLILKSPISPLRRSIAALPLADRSQR